MFVLHVVHKQNLIVKGKTLGSILNDNDQPTFMHAAEKAAVASSATLALFPSHRSFGSAY